MGSIFPGRQHNYVLSVISSGLGNKIWDTLEKICLKTFGDDIVVNPLKEFVKKLNVVKFTWHGKVFNGKGILFTLY